MGSHIKFLSIFAQLKHAHSMMSLGENESMSSQCVVYSKSQATVRKKEQKLNKFSRKVLCWGMADTFLQLLLFSNFYFIMCLVTFITSRTTATTATIYSVHKKKSFLRCYLFFVVLISYTKHNLNKRCVMMLSFEGLEQNTERIMFKFLLFQILLKHIS